MIIWDTKDGEYTIVSGGMNAFIVGVPAEITRISRSEIDMSWMDKRYKRVQSSDLPPELVEAIKWKG
jgi:hypothetical protein